MSLLAEGLNIVIFDMIYSFTPQGVTIDLPGCGQDAFETLSKLLPDRHWIFRWIGYNPHTERTTVLYEFNQPKIARESDMEFGLPKLRLVFDGHISIERI